ncbi:helix-turn-helix domain-containing protein [Granulicella sp. S190]|uniref:helix-turn-helix domain-containing protein n=1 Tax=Granulicella sp. S190 TaxID=1747226 RepID=UPI001C203A7C|nr:helix-turn-helix transcriptional regulator [Granulicella sp. S190]
MVVKDVKKRPALVDYAAGVNVAFGSKLRRLRRSQEVSQGELASRVGLSRVTIATIEGGKQNTQLHHIFLFAKALDVPPETLMPTLQEVEQQRSSDQLAGGIQTSDVLFLQDARALLLQLKKGTNENETAKQKAD